MEEDDLRQLAQNAESHRFDALEKNALALADAMTSTPADIPDKLFLALKSELDEAQLVELVHTISWENHRARMNRAFEIGSDGFSGTEYCPLPARGPAQSEVFEM